VSFDNLHQALMDLPHTGGAGFEGFVRDALSELTGQEFRLMKSGPQGGVDSIGDPNGSGLVVGMEGKHYGAKTHLGLDELKSKLRDAAEEFSALDLWVLAASRSIDGGDTKALTAIGEGLGIDVLVLDWNETSAVSPSLAILCAAAPATVVHHLGTRVTADVDRLKSHPLYAAEAARLRARLTNPSIGLSAAKAAVRNWSIRQMGDPISARFAFDSYASLEAPDAKRIDRPAVRSALDGWWASNPQDPVVLLGQEGMGKTWAALSWWLDRSAGDDFPITLVVPARDVASINGIDILAEALLRATGVRDLAFWKRRLARWSAIETDRPIILLIVDGLNQNWGFQRWSDLLLSLNVTQWRGKISALLTCRPEHWTRRLKRLGDSRLPIAEIEVKAFDDDELDALLGAHGVDRTALHPRLLELMRVPRLSDIAILRRDDFQKGGEITPERLVYEDWRYRYHGAQKAMSHEEFRSFIGTLGRQLEQQLGKTIARGEILARLSADGAEERDKLEAIFSELAEGGWLVPSNDPGQFQIDTSRVPSALGLALLDDVRKGVSPEQRREILGRHLDPLQGSDISVAILRNAATFAVIDDAVPADIKRELLEAWTQAQNFSPNDFESYWRLIGCAPGLFIAIAEEEWFRDDPSERADEILVKGFANALKWPEVANALEAKLLEWFSRYWLDKLQGEVLNEICDDEQALARRREAEGRADLAKAQCVAGTFGITLERVEPKRQAWGSYRAAELLSWLPRAPMIKVFTAWSLSRAILGGFRQVEAISWVLRWNSEDPVEAEAAILARARELIDFGGAIASDAAASLLEALATPAAQALYDQHFGVPPAPTEPPVTWPDFSGPRVDRWPLDGALTLTANPGDPDIALPAAFAERLESLASAVSDETLISAEKDLSRSIGQGIPALAHWAPAALAELIRRRSSVGRDAAVLPNLPGWLVRAWRKSAELVGAPGPKTSFKDPDWLASSCLVLSDDEIARWIELSDRLRAAGFEQSPTLQLIALGGRSAFEQIAILRRIEPRPGFSPWVTRLLAPATRKVVESLRHDLSPKAPSDSLRMWLAYLKEAGLDAIPAGWEPLAVLTGHSDGKVRAAAFELIHLSGNVALADRVAAGAWTWAKGMDGDEAAYGSLALTHSATAGRGEIADRVHPEALGMLAEDHPGQRLYLDRFATYVRDELDLLANARSRSIPRSLFTRTRGWDLLIAEYGDDLMTWTQPFVDGTARSDWFMMEQFPLIRALEATDQIEPGRKAAVAIRALKSMATSNFRSGDLYHEAARLTGPEGEEARQLALAEANEDAKLFDFAVGIQESGQTDWLLDQIDRDLAGDTAGTIARGLLLAGFLQPGEAGDELWSGRLASPPASGWLANVHRVAGDHYRRLQWSRHWNRLFRDTVDDEVAFGAFELFIETLDGRVYSGDQRPSEKELEGWSWRRGAHWSLGWDRVNAATKAAKDKLSKSFLATKQPLSNQSPRRR
jgi:hypothetical protein